MKTLFGIELPPSSEPAVTESPATATEPQSNRAKAGLINCQACGNKVSSRASACLQCGHPIEFGIVSGAKDAVIAHQKFLLKRYKDFDKYIDPFLHVLETTTPDILARWSHPQHVDAIDAFLKHREQIICLEHDILAVEFMLTALELEIPCPNCKSLHSIVVWHGGGTYSTITTESVPTADRLFGAVLTGGLSMLLPAGERQKSSFGGFNPTRVSCLECGSWIHNCSPDLYPLVKKKFARRRLQFPMEKLVDRVKGSWGHYLYDGTSVNYWERKFSSFDDYRAKSRTITRDKDFEFCPKEEFHKPEDILEKIDLFKILDHGRTSTDKQSERDRFLRNLIDTPKKGFR